MINDFLVILSKKDLRNLILLFIGMIISAIIEMIGLSSIPIFIMIIIDIDVLIQKLPYLVEIDFIKDLTQSELTIYGGLVLIFLFLGKNLYLALFLYFQGIIIKDIRSNMASNIFKKYIQAKYSFHINNNPSTLIRTVTSSISNAINTIISTVNIIKETLVLVVIFILLFLNEPLISFSIFFILALISGFYLILTRKQLILRGGIVEEEKKSQLKTINHALGSIRETKILNRENYLINLFNQQVKIIEKHGFYLFFLSQTPRLFLEFIAIFAVSAISIIFVLIDLTTKEILPIISLLAVCSIRLIPAFNTLSSSFSKRRFTQASLKIVSDALKKTPIDNRFEKEDSIGENFDKKIFKYNLEFQKVYFSHENLHNHILKNISLNIKKGHHIGIIGKSGAGKSTLVDLILGLIKPTSGKILIDDKRFEENLIKWQRLIGYVPQDIFLLDDSIKNNIAFGLNKKDINEKKIFECIKLANLT